MDREYAVPVNLARLDRIAKICHARKAGVLYFIVADARNRTYPHAHIPRRPIPQPAVELIHLLQLLPPLPGYGPTKRQSSSGMKTVQFFKRSVYRQ